MRETSENPEFNKVLTNSGELITRHSIPKGQTVKKHVIIQIAPTLSMLLNIPLPNTSNRNSIEELFEKRGNHSFPKIIVQ